MNVPSFDGIKLGRASLVDDTAQGLPFDPFVGVNPPPPAAAAPTTAPPPPPPPPAPVTAYKFFGRLTGIDGTTEIYLVKGESVVRAAPGVKLDDGFVVASVSATEVSLIYPALDAHAQIPIPAGTDNDPR